MIAGHFGFAAIVKSREKSTPLWALMLATVWLDVIFTPLFLAHLETVQPVHAGYGGLIIHADYTHSIVGMVALSAALGAMFLPRLGRRVALVIALVSASHWVLDLVVHRPDMPVLPGNLGNLPRLGFGLWNDPRAAACVELVLVVAGAALYWRAAMEMPAASDLMNPQDVGRLGRNPLQSEAHAVRRSRNPVYETASRAFSLKVYRAQRLRGWLFRKEKPHGATLRAAQHQGKCFRAGTRRLALLSAAMIAAFGLFVLFLDYTS